MTEEMIAYMAMLAVVVLLGLAARRQNREADKQGGRNRAKARISIGGRNSFRKPEEDMYTEDRRINRDWKP